MKRQRRALFITVCRGCGVKYVHSSANGAKFCDRDCYNLHAMVEHGHHPDGEAPADKRPTAERRARRLAELRSPAKTIEEDLAWMYDGKSAFIEDSRRRAVRREGGANSRRLS